jgi:hypothetical protein
MEDKKIIKNFLIFFGLEDSPYIIALWDTILAMIYFILILVNLDTNLWPFYLMYLIFSLAKIYIFMKYNKLDSRFNRTLLF